MTKYLQFFQIVFLFFMVSCQAQTEPALKEKIGQMIMVGFTDTMVNDQSAIVRDIEKLNIGGVILYEYDAVTKSRPRNITSKKQLKTLTTQLQEHAKIPLFIGIDEEGGKVSRLKTRYGFLPTVSAQYLGMLNNEDSTKYYAKQTALACKSVGVNLNFAPVVDVNVNPECPVIGGLERSFSDNSDEVAQQAGIFIEQHLNLGVYASLKHFPGHGSAKNDSHLGFTDVTNTWSREELIPYKKLIDRDLCPMIMTAHVFNAKLDSVYPATLSKKTLAVLRDSLKYNGLILSDDMMMHAISKQFGFTESLEKAVNAGVDVLLFSNNIDVYDNHIAQKAIDTIYNLVEQGKITEQRIDESYRRILVYKTKAW